jgi:hypothetical protein
MANPHGTLPLLLKCLLYLIGTSNWGLGIPRVLSKVNLIQTLVLALLTGFTWFQTERVESNLQNLEGWMFSSHYWMIFVIFQDLWAFPPEQPVVQKERPSSGTSIFPSIYLCIYYPRMGGTCSAFVGIFISQMLSSMASQSVGLFFTCVMEVEAFTTIFTVAAQLLGGYLSTNISAC